MRGQNYGYMSIITGRQGNWRIRGNKRDPHTQLPAQWLDITVVNMTDRNYTQLHTKLHTNSYINHEL